MPPKEEPDASGTSPPVVPKIPTSRNTVPAPKPLNLTSGNVAENWRKFSLIYDLYEIATGLDGKRAKVRVASLLSVIGEEGLDLYGTFEWETDTDCYVLEKVMEKFKDYCVPRSNIMYETYRFGSRVQETSENIDPFVTALRKIAENCNFGDDKDRRLRDQVVLGLRDSTVRERILRHDDPSLTAVINEIRASEVAKQHGLLINTPSQTPNENVNAVKKFQGKQNQSRPRESQGSDKIQCQKCGYTHEPKKCPAWNQTCKKCSGKNHFAKNCKNQQQTEKSKSENVKNVHVFNLGPKKLSKKTVTFTVSPTSKEIKFHIDTGASCDLVPTKIYKQVTGDRLLNKITRIKCHINCYGGGITEAIGTCDMTFQYKGSEFTKKVVIADVNDDPILGLLTCEELGIVKIQSCDQMVSTSEHVSAVDQNDSLITKYYDCFEGLGKIRGQYKIVLNPDVPAVVHAPRRVPVAVRDQLIETLKDLEEQNIITKVTRPTDWVSSITTQRKPDGRLRICLDPKDLNKAIRREHYQLPIVEDVATRLSKAKIFTLLDATWGFWQVELDEKSSYLTTFNTPFGRYRWRRMPFGISSASEVWQRKMNEFAEGLKGVEVVADDFLIIGSGDDIKAATVDHDRNLEEMLKKARSENLKLNIKKLKLRRTECPFIGHLLTGQGVKVDPRKVEGILNMPKPEDVKSVQRFMGMVTYLSKFLPKLSTIAEPLRRLADEDAEWRWTYKHEDALNLIKRLVITTPVLAYYDLRKEVTIQCDASQKGLGAVLLQEGRPVAYTSRAMTPTEQRYAQIEKEMLAIVYSCKRFHQYVYGRDKITVESDHKPLESITKKAIGSTPKRLQNMLLSVQDYNIEVTYKKGQFMFVADTLSRAYPKDNPIGAVSMMEIQNKTSCEIEFETIRAVEDVNNCPDRIGEIRESTANDPVLRNLLIYILQGWPDRKKDVKLETQQYFQYRDELVEEDGLIYKQDRIVMPSDQRRRCLELLHSAHIGIEGCLRRAREHVFWPNMNAELKEYILKCDICNSFRREQTKEPLMSLEVPSRSWSVVSADIFELKGVNYLVVGDHFSNYFEYEHLSPINSKQVILCLKRMFSRFGIPEKVISDNGRQFDCQEFKTFARTWEFEHVTSSPTYAQSNGKAENTVKICKNLMKKAEAGNTDFHLALLDWRNTPSAAVNLSPVQRLLGHRTRTLLPLKQGLLLSEGSKEVQEKLTTSKQKQADYYNAHSKTLPELMSGDTIRMKLPGQERWSKGTVLFKKGKRDYVVKVGEGEYRRNRRKLIVTTEDPPRPAQKVTSESVEQDVPKPLRRSPRLCSNMFCFSKEGRCNDIGGCNDI